MLHKQTEIAWIGLFAAILMGCGSSSTPSGSATGAGSNTSSGTGMPQDFNGCTEAAAVDHTGDPSPLVITFGGAAGLAYSPSCARISKNHQVIFRGSFDTHPLFGGAVSDGMATPDPASPIASKEAGSDDDAVNVPASGIFPFYCGVHYSSGMMGALFVK